MKKVEQIIIGLCIIIAILMMVFVIITMINYQPTTSNTSNNTSNSFIPYATVEDIEITLSPEKVIIDNYNQTISLRVDMKNIAQSDRKIVEHAYTYPTETVICYFSTNVSLYIYNMLHVDVAGDPSLPERILRPNETFTFQINLNLDEVHDYTTNVYLYEEDPDSCQLCISLVIQQARGHSNIVEIERL